MVRMDCPKFTPNIFYPSKCRQCYKCREDHQNKDGGDSSSSGSGVGQSGDVLKCGHLFIAPQDYLPQDPHSRNKRWQRRWFILRQQGQQSLLSYSIDDHPEAVPQGKIDLGSVEELQSGEERTGHEYSFILKLTPQSSSVYLKGSSSDESRKWIRLLSKYVPNGLDVISNGRLCLRRSSSSCASTGSAGTDEFRPLAISQPKADEFRPLSISQPKQSPPPEALSPPPSMTKSKSPVPVQVIGKTQPLVRLRSYNPSYEPGKPAASLSVSSVELPPKKSAGTAGVTTHLRGDPDGGEQFITVDGVHTRALSPTTKWTSATSVKPSTPPVTSVRNRLEALKLQLASRRWDLDKIANKDTGTVLKSDRVAVDSLKHQLNSSFLEIDKLSHSLNVQEGELRSLLKNKDAQLAELEKEVSALSALPLQNTLLTEENRLLVTRINDLTEKFYNMEKNSKLLKTKLHRYRTNSLKDKDLEQEVTTKVTQLESRLNQFLPVSMETPPSSPCSSATPTPSAEKKSQTLLSVILKLNELEQRFEQPQTFNPAAEWYKCGNCEFLQEEIQERDAKLNEFEAMVHTLEATLEHTQSIRTKYEAEVAEVQTLCSQSLNQLEAAYNRLVGELEEKHQVEMTQFELSKEQELEEETRATKETLELLKRSYEAELANGVAEAKQNLRRKYAERGTALQELHRRHEEETQTLREKVNQLALKYSEKCVECGQLQEALLQRST